MSSSTTNPIRTSFSSENYLVVFFYCITYSQLLLHSVIYILLKSISYVFMPFSIVSVVSFACTYFLCILTFKERQNA